MNAEAGNVYSNYCAKHYIYTIPVLLPLGQIWSLVL